MDRLLIGLGALGIVILLFGGLGADWVHNSELHYGEATGEPRRVHAPPASTAESWTFLDGPGRVLDPVLVSLGPRPSPPIPNSPEEVATRVLDSSVVAASPPAPSFRALPEHLPQKLWTPTWRGVAPFYAEHKCPAFRPVPRLWALSLNELQQARARDLGQTQLLEPIGARQNFVQLLTEGWRSRKDKYTRASPSNDLAQSVCAELLRTDPTSE